MDKKKITYTFTYAEKCNMCMGTSFKVLGKRLNQSQGKNPQRKTGITTTVVQCITCGLIFANPVPVPQNISDHYDMEVDDYFKSIYKSQSGLRGLDIGTGLGGIMRALEKGGIEAHGLEPSKSFYDFAVSKGIPNDRIHNQSTEDANFPNYYFDLIIFSAVFEHLYNPNQALVNALKWLKPGGIIYIGVPSNRIFVQQLANFFYKLKGLDYVSNISPMHPPFHLYEFGKETFDANSKINDYSIAHFEYWTVRDYLFPKSNFLVRKIIKLTKSDMNLTIWLRKNG